MNMRQLIYIICAGLVATSACNKQDTAADAPIVSTNLKGLARWAPLPGIASARWTGIPAGGGTESGCLTIPGPTDYYLYGVVKLTPEGWSEFESKMGPPQGEGGMGIPEAVAAKLFEPAELNELPLKDNHRIIRGPSYYIGTLTGLQSREERGIRRGDTLVIYHFSM